MATSKLTSAQLAEDPQGISEFIFPGVSPQVQEVEDLAFTGLESLLAPTSTVEEEAETEAALFSKSAETIEDAALLAQRDIEEGTFGRGVGLSTITGDLLDRLSKQKLDALARASRDAFLGSRAETRESRKSTLAPITTGLTSTQSRSEAGQKARQFGVESGSKSLTSRLDREATADAASDQLLATGLTAGIGGLATIATPLVSKGLFPDKTPTVPAPPTSTSSTIPTTPPVSPLLGTEAGLATIPEDFTADELGLGVDFTTGPEMPIGEPLTSGLATIPEDILSGPALDFAIDPLLEAPLTSGLESVLGETGLGAELGAEALSAGGLGLDAAGLGAAEAAWLGAEGAGLEALGAGTSGLSSVLGPAALLAIPLLAYLGFDIGEPRTSMVDVLIRQDPNLGDLASGSVKVDRESAKAQNVVDPDTTDQEVLDQVLAAVQANWPSSFTPGPGTRLSDIFGTYAREQQDLALERDRSQSGE
mgnify:CR=1 FL=1